MRLIPELSGHACLEPLLVKLDIGLRMSVFSGPNLIIPLALHSREWMLGVYVMGLDHPESPAILAA